MRIAKVALKKALIYMFSDFRILKKFLTLGVWGWVVIPPEIREVKLRFRNHQILLLFLYNGAGSCGSKTAGCAPLLFLFYTFDSLIGKAPFSYPNFQNFIFNLILLSSSKSIDKVKFNSPTQESTHPGRKMERMMTSMQP